MTMKSPSRAPIAAARLALGLRQEDLARLAGVAQSTVSKLEALGRPPELRVAIALSRTLGRTVEELFGHLVPRTPRRRVRATPEGAATEAAE